MTTIAFTRPERRLDDSIALAEGMGFKVLAAPSLEIAHGDKAGFSDSADRLLSGAVDEVIFASSTAVEECVTEWGARFPLLMGGKRIIAIGPGTASSLDSAGVLADMLPSRYSSEGLVELAASDPGKRRMMVIHSDHGSDVLIDGLRSAGFEVFELVAYRLLKNIGDPDIARIREASLRGDVDVIALTSPMSAESFVESMGEDIAMITKRCRFAAIGDPTATRLRSLGIHVDIIPEHATFESLLRTIKNESRGE